MITHHQDVDLHHQLHPNAVLLTFNLLSCVNNNQAEIEVGPRELKMGAPIIINVFIEIALCKNQE